ncbi:MAG: 2-amino-4-hydroxy-6-hydroxymethyldihydropteridine diphosphokinase [Bacteriovoracaceae bacterium]|nr:2-amino-4-hydroxy-6-hydroxymethyldihydropteridine diphosphokinase [Bacteriovoracaceae bacterium]
MSLIIATGSNIGDKLKNLQKAKNLLSETFDFIAESRIYTSSAVDYSNQPDFLNQVLEFKIPSQTPETVMLELLEKEKILGRQRVIDKGPRTIDMDIIFWAEMSVNTDTLQVPHPRWRERAFVVLPLMELPFFELNKNKLNVSLDFDHEAFALS